MTIQWFPGHMAKATREVKENLKLVDIVFELVDARCPLSSHNMYLDEVVKDKKKVIIFNKIDLCDKKETAKWKKYFEERGYKVVYADAKNSNSLNGIIGEAKEELSEKFERMKAKGIKPRAIRSMVIGVPNVGKSTFINKMIKKNVANTANRPGVTKKQQWLKLNKDIDLLDTPGILMPKFDNQEIGKKLSLIASIKDDITPLDEVALYLIEFLKKYHFEDFKSFYKIDISKDSESLEIMQAIAKKRFKLIAGDYDYDAAIKLLIQDFRTQKFGLITLDKYEDMLAHED
ncbi:MULTISPECIES: ribosome biogenesis GTPase YlqF [unclassified Gemella]|uniref:ribosome biogenesis GTPase YlqF n=1 Tax=unclassified Gemella TaxID=2624949 RepID=UPI0010740F05|nr:MULTISPECIES: ribosome biogenesis GTPase YlqF [unclassified Gemella]MBF0710295.1 ribosome biogenesis GTPase YlqF [Gemella sp. GL1.1]MBF0746971.1 ribosome biogenesis GTPase YlqF [Gemella sp. 19428wG2_WT2a]NYS27639.1 ribosome biogenesis GTPase YlqF [Gemella sp. GL1]TFU58789.1 ribosome biogenesis GTPase YlqF [Gemella sp. WT2a]